MKYDFNGKILNIPDKDLEVLEKNLDIPRNEAIQCWLEDNDYTVSEEAEELTEKAKSVRRYEKSDKKRKTSARERKVDEEKKRFLDGFRIYAEGAGGIVTNQKNEAEFSFNFGENEYTVKLIKHRKK